MENISLYRKYRPTSFEELCGQTVIKETIKNSITHNKISHAYLFAGPRGTGKTTTAKIIAKSFNCQNPEEGNACNKCSTCLINNNPDIIELDAASNNGVDEIRNIIAKVNFVPSYGKYKIYIIDEVHMLSIGAFNALLKTLEEPPAHIIFILATTELHKIPMTILSRCQCYEFKKINIDDIIKRIKYIAEQEKISISDDAILEIALNSDGALRDAINMLDQVSSLVEKKIEIADVHEIIGNLNNNDLKHFLGNISLGNIEKCLKNIKDFENSGKNYIKICEEIIRYYKNQILDNYKSQKNLNNDLMFNLINITMNAIQNLKNGSNQELIFELYILELINTYVKEKKIIVNESETDVKEETNELKLIKKQEDNSKNNNIEITSKLKDFIEIRINNCFVNPNKDLKKKVIDILNNNKINISTMDSKVNNYLEDSEVMVANDEYLMFVTKYSAGANVFNENTKKIERVLNKLFENNYKMIAVSSDKWKSLKEDFIKNQGKYNYMPEIEIDDINEIQTLLGNDIVVIEGE